MKKEPKKLVIRILLFIAKILNEDEHLAKEFDTLAQHINLYS